MRTLSPQASRSVDFLAALLVGCHAAWLFAYFTPAFVGPDAGGLYVQARLIADGLGTVLVAESPAQFIGNHWMERFDGTFASRFPPGLPVVLAALYALGGPTLALLMTPVLASVAVWLIYLIVKGFASSWMALGAAFVMATLPSANRFALHNDSTTVTVACFLTGIWLLSRWDAKPMWWRALLAGLVLGLIPTIRYAEAIFGLSVGVFLLIRVCERPRLRSHLMWAMLGAAAPLAMLATHSWMTYGAPWLTGYTYSGEAQAFTITNFFAHAPLYVRAIFSWGGLGALSVLGLYGMVWMLFERRWRAWGALSASAVVAVTLLYGAYYWPVSSGDPLALRFFVPVLPLYLLSAVWVLARVPRPGVRVPLTLLVIGSQVVVGAIQSRQALGDEWMQSSHGTALVVAVEMAVPEGSVLIAPRSSLEVLDYYGEWRLVADWLFPGSSEREEKLLTWDMDPEVAALLASAPGPIQLDKFGRSRSHYAGLVERELAEVVWDDLRIWAPGAEVYWIGRPEDVERMILFLPSLRVHPILEIHLPSTGNEMPYWVPDGPLSLYRISERSARLLP